MYGMTPSAKIDRRSSAPPENMLNMFRIVPCCSSKKRASAMGSMPGTGMNVPMRYDHERAEQEEQPLSQLCEAGHLAESGQVGGGGGVW